MERAEKVERILFRLLWIDFFVMIAGLAISLVIGVVVLPLVLPNPARIICSVLWYPVVALGLVLVARRIARRRPTFQRIGAGTLRYWRGLGGFRK
jgi:hypothetical protein